VKHGVLLDCVQRFGASQKRRYTARIFAGLMLLALVLMPCLAVANQAQMRFPKPEFIERPYHVPDSKEQVTNPRAVWLEYLDVSILTVALSLSAYLVLKQRSRRAVLALTVACLAYFGFWRQGCLCPVGSVQNVALAVFPGTYVIPVTALFIFLLPLLFALMFGRVFCASVCPLGAIQDLVHRKNVDVPHWLAAILGLMPYAYLGLAILLVGTGAGFIVCQYDPFVGFFRFGAPQSMIIFGVVLLAIGVFIGRPYCRFLCPYGVLLNWMSRFSLKHASITPKECINCRLCEQSCPYGCIEATTPERATEKPRTGRRRLAIALALAPLIVGLGALAVAMLHVPLSRLHPKIRLAERMLIEERGIDANQTLETESFRQLGKDSRQLYDQALHIRHQFKWGGAILGAFLGGVIAMNLIGLARKPVRAGYEIERGTCFSCARCFEFCPVELDRRGQAGIQPVFLGQFSSLPTAEEPSTTKPETADTKSS
jgi:ferredoxin